MAKQLKAGDGVSGLDAMDDELLKGDMLLLDLEEETDPGAEPPMLIRSGINLLDRLLNGGLRGGKMTEIFGENRTGKTDLGRSFSENFLQDYEDSRVWYYDQEFALNKISLHQYPAFQKVDASGKKRFRPFVAENMEQFFGTLFKAFKKAIEMKAQRLPLLIVLDSLPALRPIVELEEDNLEKAIMMKQAALLSQAIPKLRRMLHKTGAHVIIINQLRDKPSIGGGGPPMEAESPGGKAVKFYADARLVTTRVGRFSFAGGKTIKKGTRPSGFFNKTHIRKNKLGIPEREVEIPLTYMPALGQRSGLSDPWSLFYSFRAVELIKLKGGRFTLGTDTFDRKGWIAVYEASVDNGNRIRPGSALDDAINKWTEHQMAADVTSLSEGVEEEEAA